ncbi:MAG: HAD family hydrolase [candidate division WOR-3 bacterium]|nr:MAG: HAD family hydrolase [candidate division WOR-3 bacterium]
MAVRAILIDLDDTLVPDQAAADDAIRAAAELAQAMHDIDPEALRASLRRRCRELWLSHPVIARYENFYVSSWEGLTSEFATEPEESRQLRDWVPDYRRQSWANALADFGVSDPALVQALVDRLQLERTERYIPYPDVEPVLQGLKDRYSLVIVSNGTLDTQQRKLECSGLAGYFSAVVISEPLGFQKPDPGIYQEALKAAARPASECVMLGNSLRNDVGGAQGAGIRAVWLNRNQPVENPDPRPEAVITSLSELPAAIARLG